MIAIKVILFFFGLLFSTRFISDVIIRTIGSFKNYTDEEWHEAFVRGWINPLEFARNYLPMLLVWTAFYLINQF